MNRLMRLIATLVLTVPSSVMAADLSATLYKSPHCGCCTAHAEYLRDNGYEVDVIATGEMPRIKEKHGVPAELASCHTLLIGNYVVEGHVPVESIDKLLAERPMTTGITVPGMPMGSPGMGGEKQEPLKVYYITRNATPRVHSVH